MSTFIIAEIGSAWRSREFDIDDKLFAFEAVEVAKRYRADAIKFQWTSDPRYMGQRRNVASGAYDILHYPIGWIKDIHNYCKKVGIEFICSVFLPKDVDSMNPYVNRWKVASLENQADDLVVAMLSTGKPIIISHGATGVIDDVWGKSYQVLHCTAAYPAPLQSLNLMAIKSMRYAGYSDHSCNVLTGALAVACGAKIVEVHFRLNCTSTGNPDFKHSLTPMQLKEYIQNIRQAEIMLGSGKKRIEPCEEWAIQHKVKS